MQQIGAWGGGIPAGGTAALDMDVVGLFESTRMYFQTCFGPACGAGAPPEPLLPVASLPPLAFEALHLIA